MLKKTQIFILLLGSLTQYHNVIAATWTDPKTGYTFTYRINGAEAEIFNDNSPAITPIPAGTVTIPTTLGGAYVRVIGAYAFYNCSDLTGVTIPDSVKQIGSSAFYGCSGLTSLTISDSVRSIGSSAFYGCNGLRNVTIGNSLNSIGGSAFSYCGSLTSFAVDVGNNYFSSVEGMLLTKDGKTLIRGVNGDVVLPDSVTSIESWAFSGCSSPTHVTIGNNVTSIGYSAFYGCRGLTGVTIPDSVTSIGSYAFADCSDSLFDMTTIPGVKLVDGWVVGRSGGSVNGNLNLTGIRGIVDRAFSDCGSLTGVVIPDNMTNIGEYAFRNCSSLSDVVIPSCTTRIRNGVFSGCRSITSLVIPDMVASIGYEAFSGCTGLTNVTIGKNVTSFGQYAFGNCNALTSVTIRQCVCVDNLSDIFSSSYQSITNVFVSGCVTNIGASVFSKCTSLLSIEADTDNEYYSSVNGLLLTKNKETLVQGVNGEVIIPDSVRVIGCEAFWGRDGLMSVTIPNGVTNIERYAFRNCSGLTSMEIPDSVSHVGQGAFLYCSGITNVILPHSVKSIEDSTFYGCSGLIGVTIEKDVTSIGQSAFRNCSGLTKVIIPDRIESLGRDAFNGCSGLTNVTFEGVAPAGLTSSSITGRPNSIYYKRKYAQTFSTIIPKSDFAGFYYEGLSDYVCFGDIVFITEGTMAWVGDFLTSHDGYESLKNGLIGNGESSWMEATVNGSGRVSFWWKASSEEINGEIYDYAFLSIDGVAQGMLNGEKLSGIAIGGKTDWTNVVLDVVGDGPHVIRWTYCKDETDEGDVGDDCVWIDEFSFLPKPTISFEVGELTTGETPASIQAFKDEVVTLPSNDKFTWADHVFDGWSDGQASFTPGASYIIPATNTTLTALWIAKSFVLFDIGGGGGSVPELIKALPRETITLPDDNTFAWTDHVFNGWSDGTANYAGGADYTVPLSNVTLTARWIAKSFVSFDIGEGTGTLPETIKDIPNAVVVLPSGIDLAWTDHVFNGWSDGTTNYIGGATYTVPSSNVTLTARWIAKSFVSFDIGEGTGTPPETIKDVPNAVVALPSGIDFEWSDHVFDGWYDGAQTYAAGSDYIVPSSNITLTAKWIAKTFVSFAPNGAVGNLPELIKALPDDVVSLPAGEGLSLTDHVFDGWTDGVGDYAAGADYTVPASNVTLSAVWIAKRFLTFTLDGGEGEIPITIKDVPTATVTLPSADGFNKPKYHFVGWSNGTQTYDAGAKYVVTDAGVEFTAVWAANTLEAPAITSADVVNGGTIETESATIEIEATDGTSIYYTTDGTEPTTNSVLYTGAFAVDGLTPTVLAFAVRDNYFDSPVAEFSFVRKPYSAAECLNVAGKVVSTGGEDAAWGRVLGAAAHDGVAALRSGAIGEGGSSTVEMSVDGAGEIGFWWKTSCETATKNKQRDFAAFYLDGTEQCWMGGITDWSNKVFTVSGDGAHSLKWVYRKNDNGVTEGDDCAWLDEVTWTPWNEITTKQTVVPIPYGWLDSYGLLSGSDPEIAAKQPTGKRDGRGRLLTVEDDFIAGTDPTNENDVFSVSISMSNGFPVVEWRPNLNTNGGNRVYTIYGKATLDEEWTTPTNALSHFFKVEVAMPSQNKSDDTTGGNDNIGGDTPGDNGGSGEEPTGDDSGSTENSIPAGYSTNGVSCVTCTGSEWYDLGLPPTLTMKVQIKHSYAGEYEHTGIIGAMPQSNNDISDWRLFIANGPQYRWYLDYPGASGGLGVGSRISGGSTALNTIYEIEFGNFYVKDIPSNAVIISDASVVKECPSNNIRLFKINYAYPERIATGSVYYVKIYDMNASGEYELVRNLVPCKPDNAPAGLLDLIEMKFYKNNGTWISLAQ